MLITSLFSHGSPFSTFTLFSLFKSRFLSTITRGNFVKSVMSSFSPFSSGDGAAARAFQLRLNPFTGDSEWVVVDEDEDEEPQALTEFQSFLATTSYLDMLNDRRRNRAFRLAVEKAVTGPCRVLDIGVFVVLIGRAGTGLLSMIAARATGGKGEVWACESYLPMVKLMRKVLRENGMEGQVRVFHKRSDELRVGVDLHSRADVLVSEILDSELLGEGLIPTLQHAHDMLLVDQPKTVPYRATIYGQLVESTSLWKLHDLHNNEVNGLDGVRLTPVGLDRIVSVRQKQHAMHCNAISKEIRLLSEPFKIFEFDFWKRPESHGEIEIRIAATNDGKVQAVVSWWVLQLDCDGSIWYSTAPNWISSSNNSNKPSCDFGSTDWCDHWKQCVWFVPGAGMPVFKDEQVLFQAAHDDTSISYSLKIDVQKGYDASKAEDFHLMLLPERIAAYGDKEWRLALLAAVRNALQSRPSPLCVVTDDSLFLTILAATRSKASYVISSFPGLREKGASYIQAVADANGFSMDRVRISGKRISCLNKDVLNQRKIDLLLGEPFYCGTEGMLPWQNLRFWKERTLLNSVVSDDAFIMPSKGILKACAMSLPDLWRSRCILRKIEGFDHSVVNESLGACGGLPPLHESPCLPYFIWQCGEIEELSEIFTVMEFNFSDPICACCEKQKIVFTKPGLCHGFALWIDWVLDENNSIIISTGPVSRYWKQGVKLLSNPVNVNINDDVAELEASFNPSTGEITVRSFFSKL